MADDAVTIEQLRRWYVDTLRASVLATDPVRVTAWTGLAAEIRHALIGVGVTAYKPSDRGWRLTSEEVPPDGVVVLCDWGTAVYYTAHRSADNQWLTTDGPIEAPVRWVAL